MLNVKKSLQLSSKHVKFVLDIFDIFAICAPPPSITISLINTLCYTLFKCFLADLPEELKKLFKKLKKTDGEFVKC